jgi:hypothetical protein
MVNLGMSVFKLAELYLIKNKKKYTLPDIVDKAYEIRKWLDKHGENTVKKILQGGGKIYRYGNKIKIKA